MSRSQAAEGRGTETKRIKRSSRTDAVASHAKVSPRRTKLFQPFRALGLVTDSVPFVLRVRHGGKDAVKPDIQILTCIGQSWMMWDADRMTLQFVGEPVSEDIQSLVVVSGNSGKDNILATSGRKVCRFVRGKLVDELRCDSLDDAFPQTNDSSSLLHLLAVGDNVLAVSASGKTLYVWSLSQLTLLRSIDLSVPIVQTSDTFQATSIVHPSTYVDKVLLGSAQGHLQLYNFRTSTLLHTFSCSALLSYMGRSLESFAQDDASTAIVDLVQTPAIDVIAVVFAAGYVLLLDIRYDEPVMYARVSRDATARNILGRSSVTFRTDALAHTMAVGTLLGDIILFDLGSSSPAPGGSNGEGKRARPAQLAHTIRTAHDDAIASVQFLQGQPLLISSGADNAIKQWFFEVNSVAGTGDLGDKSDLGYSQSMTAPPRLLKSREGHSLPPRLIRYIGEGGKTIISTGGDDRSVRAISVVRDSRSAELSQGSMKKRANRAARSAISFKLPPVTSLAHSSTRTRDWDDLVTTHADMKFAQSWSTRNARIGTNHLHATTGGKNVEQSTATTTQVSACGNFAIVGNALGYAEMYNIQSSRYRARFDTRTLTVQRVAKKMKSGAVQWKEEAIPMKGSSVTGVVCDSVNKTVALSTAEGKLRFFDFHTSALLKTVDSRAGITKLMLHRATNLIAAAHDDNSISLYDMETYKPVRLFTGFADTILDMTFSPDGRWLVVSAMDGFVRTYDIPTSRLVDYFYTPQPAVSLTFSPLGDFLATVHRDTRGIYLWANRNQYLNLPLSGIDEVEVLASRRFEGHEESLPTLRGIDVDALAEEDAQLKELDVGEAEYQRTFTSKPQLFLSDTDEDRRRDGLLTLSTMPRSRWMTLLNLDVIKARNKPKEAPKKPEQAPFFLPVGASSVPDSALTRSAGAALGDMQSDGDAAMEGRRLQPFAQGEGLQYETALSRRLSEALTQADDESRLDALFIYLHALSPPALDSEIRSLVRLQDITHFLQCMTKRLAQHLDYDAVQAMVAVALRVHGDVIVANGVKLDGGKIDEQEDEVEEEEDDDENVDQEGAALAEALRALMAEQYREGNRLLDLVQYCMGSLAFVRDMPLA